MASIKDIIPGGFNSADVEPAAGRDHEPLPAGLYSCEISNSEVKENSKRTGHVLALELTVIEPAQHARRKLWSSINLSNASAEAERIGRSELSALCRAVGIPILEDSDQLFQKMLRVRTKIRPAGPGKDGKHYEAKAEVAAWEPAGAGPVPTTAAAQAPMPAGKPAAKPWERRAA